jgi:hypothetical protein
MSYPLWNAFLTMMWFFIWVMWLFMLFWIIADIFRSHDLSGWAKTGWVVFVCILPFVGVFTYLIVRGSNMQNRNTNRYTEDRLSTLNDLRDQGVITEADFEQAKAKVLR